MGDVPRKSGEAVALQVRKVGDGLGVVLPEELLRRLGVTEGGVLHLVEDGEGGVRLAQGGSVLDRGMDSARKAMDRYRNALAELAK